MGVNSAMTALANAIRSKSGKTGKMGIDAMTEAVNGISVGATVQRKTGSFTTTTRDNRSWMDATVNCGFKPDVVVIKGKLYGESSDGSYRDMIAVFPERTSGRRYYVEGADNTYITLEGTIEQTTNGFVFEVWAYNMDWSEATVRSTTYDYVVIKYTE